MNKKSKNDKNRALKSQRSNTGKYGKWHTVYTRLNRWSKNGVLQRVFEGLRQGGIIQTRVESVCMDSTTVNVHPNGTLL
ncbi:transposase [bacterium D16-76]|nr:transposase [bacterium D16-76]